jgi:hypothetical protein
MATKEQAFPAVRGRCGDQGPTGRTGHLGSPCWTGRRPSAPATRASHNPWRKSTICWPTDPDGEGEFRTRQRPARHPPSIGQSVLRQRIQNDVGRCFHALQGHRKCSCRPTRGLPPCAFKISSRTRDKYVRGARKYGALETGFITTGVCKTQIATQINKLNGCDAVEREPALWKKALIKLSTVLET